MPGVEEVSALTATTATVGVMQVAIFTFAVVNVLDQT
jgi:hypothetical protein